MFISQVVIDEAKFGDPQAAAKRLNVLNGINHLDISEEVEYFSNILVEREILPLQSLEDALHVAVSCISGIDYLLTWNCKHIANAKKRGEVERVCLEFGYVYPTICTPEELL